MVIKYMKRIYVSLLMALKVFRKSTGSGVEAG